MRLLRREDRRRHRRLGRAQVDVHVEGGRRPASNRARNSSGVGPSAGRSNSIRWKNTAPAPLPIRVDVLLGVDDVAALLGDEAGRGRDDARSVGTRQQEHRMTWRSFYRAQTRSTRRRSRRRRSASRRRRPSGCGPGVRDGEQRVAQPGPFRADQDGRPARPASSVVDRDRRSDRASSPGSASRRGPAVRRRGGWCGRGGGRTPSPSPPAAIVGRAGRHSCDRGSARRSRTPRRCG